MTQFRFLGVECLRIIGYGQRNRISGVPWGPPGFDIVARGHTRSLVHKPSFSPYQNPVDVLLATAPYLMMSLPENVFQGLGLSDAQEGNPVDCQDLPCSKSANFCEATDQDTPC